MKYVDGFVLVVPKKNLGKYRKMALEAGKVWKKHGALEYLECVGNDMNPYTGGMKSLTFPKMVKAKSGEKVLFSFIVYKNKKHRNQVNSKVMKEFEKNKDMHKDMVMPFDMKKMAYGGFEAIVEK
jgi:uncharacterized protein YbaA (DUF1428 family)